MRRRHTNYNLYAYGANNPVHYIDPDGRSPNLPFITFDDFWNFFSDVSSGSDKVVTKGVAALNGNESARIQLNELSPYMSKVMSKAAESVVIGGMEFVAENGTTLALVAYATGHVEVGTVIDGITITCDITLKLIEAHKTNDSTNYLITILADVVSIAVAKKVGDKSAQALKELINGIPDSLTLKAIDSMSNILSEYASSSAGAGTAKITNDVVELFGD